MPCAPEDEEPDHPVWQLVVSFCCKGMIEGIIVLLLLWLLIQVLFIKNLEGSDTLINASVGVEAERSSTKVSFLNPWLLQFAKVFWQDTQPQIATDGSV